jgi:hypothetical protein
MVYSLIPNAGQSLGETRDGIKENFTTIQDAFQVDHVAYDATGEGFHSKVTFPQGTAPTVAVDNVVLYAKDTNSRPTIFMRQENNGSEVQLSGPTPSVGSNGSTFLPGGLLFQWGFNASAGNASVVFPTAFSSLYSITIGTRGNSGSSGYHRISTESATGFSVQATATSGFYWMAVGTI